VRAPTILALLAACNGSGFKPLEDRGGAELGSAEAGLDARASDARRDSPPTPVSECPGPVKSEDVDDKKEPGRYTSIVVDPATGDLHVSHFAQGPTPDILGNGGYHDARYSVRRNGSWTNEEIYTPGVVGGFTAIGFTTGKVHVAFYDWAQKKLLWSWRDTSSWKSPKVIAGEGNVGWGNDLATDSGGGVHAVTFAGSMSTNQGKVLYLRRVGVDWQAPVTLEAAAGEQGPKSGIVVRPDGKVAVSLCDGAGQLKLVVGAEGSFGAPQILDGGLGSSCGSDLAVDGSGDLHVAYYDSTKKVLKYIGQASGVFGQPLVLDSSGVVGSYNAIAATPAGDLWVAYYDFTNLDLRVIRRRAKAWGQPETVDSAGHVGRYVSAAIGLEGELHVMHWSEDASALRHTRICP
jgi:hypothetical protein